MTDRDNQLGYSWTEDDHCELEIRWFGAEGGIEPVVTFGQRATSNRPIASTSRCQVAVRRDAVV